MSFLILVAAGSFFALILLREDSQIFVDFTKAVGIISLDYGLNEEANWMDFVNRKETHEFHKNVGSEYIRIWVDDPSFRLNSTIPYKNGVYDFRKLDDFINAVLDSNAIPFVVFAHAPLELSDSYGEQENAHMPLNNYDFAEYTTTIVKHYRNLCNNNKLNKKCDIDEWYWEIWNEPYWDYFWTNDEYIKIYNEAYTSIKKVAPNTNVGGYTLKLVTGEDQDLTIRFLKGANGIDFISLHVYGNYPIPGLKDNAFINELQNSFMRNQYEQEMIRNNKYLFFEQIKLLQNFIKDYRPGEVEIIISELGPNWNWRYEPYFDEPFVAAWYASALYWMIRSNLVAKEFYYSGTSNKEDGGFAMWAINDFDRSFNLFPVYHMKKEFVRYNTKGSVIRKAETNDKYIEILAVSNKNGNFLTIINKKNQLIENIAIDIKNLKYDQIVDLTNNKNIDKSDLDLNPYEVKFLKII